MKLKSKAEIQFQWIRIEELNWERYRSVFVEAFTHQLIDFSDEELNLKTNKRDLEIQNWFSEEITSENKFIMESKLPGSLHKAYFLEAFAHNQVIAYSIWHWSKLKLHEIYQSSLCVLPNWQGQGIGTQIVKSINSVVPEVTCFFVNTIKSEKNIANKFYRDHLKCKECAVIPDESLKNPHNYIGYKGLLDSLR